VSKSGIRPWGITHEHKFVSLGTPGHYEVSTHYILRMKIPKYVRVMIRLGIIPASLFEQDMKEKLTGNFRGGNIEVFLSLHQAQPEMTVILRYPDRYFKDIVKGYCLRCREVLGDYLDVCRAAVIEAISEGNEYTGKLVGFSINAKTRGIRCPRHLYDRL
jgi:hypothetical protein